MSTLVSAGNALTGGPSPLALSPGVTLPMNQSVALVMDLGLLSLHPEYRSPYDEPGYLQVLVSAGVSFTPFPRLGPFYFFVQPKLLGIVSSETEGFWESATRKTKLHLAGTSFEVQAALDMGLADTFGHFYLAAFIGAGVGYCNNCGDDKATSAYPPGIFTLS